MTKAELPQKTCPECNAAVPATLPRCACGHQFEPAADRPRPHGELTAKAEALYESYLRARVTRAQKALSTAKLDLKRHPGNRNLRDEVKRAEQELWVLQTDLSIQTIKAAEARKNVEQARAEQTAETATAASGATGTDPANLDAELVQSPPSPEPSANFRVTQAKIAEAALKAVKAKMAAKANDPQGGSRVFMTAQAAKAEQAVQMAQAEQIRECPECGTVISGTVTRCKCGYLFPDDTNQIQPFITEDEISALREQSISDGKNKSEG